MDVTIHFGPDDEQAAKIHRMSPERFAAIALMQATNEGLRRGGEPPPDPEDDDKEEI